jgi:hypothetical protein
MARVKLYNSAAEKKAAYRARHSVSKVDNLSSIVDKVIKSKAYDNLASSNVLPINNKNNHLTTNSLETDLTCSASTTATKSTGGDFLFKNCLRLKKLKTQQRQAFQAYFRRNSMLQNSSAKKRKLSEAQKHARKCELRQCHQVLGFDAYLTVEGTANRLNCTTRRVRQLLQEGRLVGGKDGKSWFVKYPFMFQIGKRGPVAQLFNDVRSVSSFASQSLNNSGIDNVFSINSKMKGV